MTDKIAATPGPWRYSVSDYDGEFVITGSNEGGGSVLPILGRTHNFPRNAEANARLISAAPDLLAALTNLIAHIDRIAYRDSAQMRLSDNTPFITAARAAIAKAEVR